MQEHLHGVAVIIERTIIELSDKTNPFVISHRSAILGFNGYRPYFCILIDVLEIVKDLTGWIYEDKCCNCLSTVIYFHTAVLLKVNCLILFERKETLSLGFL